eukprot:tig00021537_g22270.t1
MTTYHPASPQPLAAAIRSPTARAAGAYVLLFVCTVFGGGFMSVPIFGVLQPFALLLCWRVAAAARPVVHAFLIFLTLLLGAWAAFAGVFSGVPVPEAVRVLLPVGVAAVVSALSLVPLALDRLACTRWAWAQHAAFPVSLSAVWFAFSLASPIGTTGSPAYAAFNAGGVLVFQPLAALVSLGGVPLAVAALGYIAAFLCSLLPLPAPGPGPAAEPHPAASPVPEAPLSPADAGSVISAGRPSLELPSSPLFDEPPTPRAHRRQRRRAAAVFATLAGLALLYASTRGAARTWPQRPVEGRIPAHVRMACLASQANGTTGAGTWEPLLAESEALLSGPRPADLVIWSEEAADLADRAEEAALLSAAAAVARRRGRALGVSYLVHDAPGAKRNMFVLFGGGGAEALRWQKARPVPGVEPDVVPGPGAVRTVDLGEPLGRVAAVICFDADSPAMVRAAAGADFLLQPSWTWGPIGEYFAADNALRALEAGFTLFRCTTGGVSGAFGPYGEVFGMKTIGRAGSMVLEVPRYGPVVTLYALWGDLVGWTALALTAAFLLFLAADAAGARRLCPARWPSQPRAPPAPEPPPPRLTPPPAPGSLQLAIWSVFLVVSAPDLSVILLHV